MQPIGPLDDHLSVGAAMAAAGQALKQLGAQSAPHYPTDERSRFLCPMRHYLTRLTRVDSRTRSSVCSLAFCLEMFDIAYVIIFSAARILLLGVHENGLWTSVSCVPRTILQIKSV